MAGLTKAEARRHRALARALDRVAKDLEEEASRIRRAAENEEHLANWTAQIAALPDMLDEVRRWIDFGKSEPEAIAIVADVHEVRPDFLTAHWQEDQRTRPRARKWRRDREIMRLAWLGRLSNGEIATRMNLTPKSVSRIIQQRLKAVRTRKPRPPGEFVQDTKGEPPCALPSPPLQLPSP